MMPRRWKKTVTITREQHEALWSALCTIDNDQMGHEDDWGNRMRRDYHTLERLYRKLAP